MMCIICGNPAIFNSQKRIIVETELAKETKHKPMYGSYVNCPELKSILES